MNLNILLSGDGGQGIQTMADIICRAVFGSGKHVSHIPNYGLEQRGGSSLAFIKISDNKIGYPKFTRPDILLVLSDSARKRTERYKIEDAEKIDIVDYKDRLAALNIPARSHNIYFMAVLAKILEKDGMVKIEDIQTVLREKLGKKPDWEEIHSSFSSGLKA
jgi:2-oxoglutarate ferredoxin oxidoreductase subunit gamma